jgi:hypothetical protein
MQRKILAHLYMLEIFLVSQIKKIHAQSVTPALVQLMPVIYDKETRSVLSVSVSFTRERLNLLTETDGGARDNGQS